MSAEPVSVRILDREYTVGVGGDERDSLMAAARLLDARMREIRGSNRMAAVQTGNNNRLAWTQEGNNLSHPTVLQQGGGNMAITQTGGR